MEQDYLNKTVTSQGRKRGEDGNSEVRGSRENIHESQGGLWRHKGKENITFNAGHRSWAEKDWLGFAHKHKGDSQIMLQREIQRG